MVVVRSQFSSLLLLVRTLPHTTARTATRTHTPHFCMVLIVRSFLACAGLVADGLLPALHTVPHHHTMRRFCCLRTVLPPHIFRSVHPTQFHSPPGLPATTLHHTVYLAGSAAISPVPRTPPVTLRTFVPRAFSFALRFTFAVRYLWFNLLRSSSVCARPSPSSSVPVIHLPSSPIYLLPSPRTHAHTRSHVRCRRVPTRCSGLLLRLLPQRVYYVLIYRTFRRSCAAFYVLYFPSSHAHAHTRLLLAVGYLRSVTYRLVLRAPCTCMAFTFYTLGSPPRTHAVHLRSRGCGWRDHHTLRAHAVHTSSPSLPRVLLPVRPPTALPCALYSSFPFPPRVGSTPFAVYGWFTPGAFGSHLPRLPFPTLPVYPHGWLVCRRAADGWLFGAFPVVHPLPRSGLPRFMPPVRCSSRFSSLILARFAFPAFSSPTTPFLRFRSFFVFVRLPYAAARRSFRRFPLYRFALPLLRSSSSLTPTFFPRFPVPVYGSCWLWISSSPSSASYT